LVSRKYLF